MNPADPISLLDLVTKKDANSLRKIVETNPTVVNESFDYFGCNMTILVAAINQYTSDPSTLEVIRVLVSSPKVDLFNGPNSHIMSICSDDEIRKLVSGRMSKEQGTINNVRKHCLVLVLLVFFIATFEIIYM